MKRYIIQLSVTLIVAWISWFACKGMGIDTTISAFVSGSLSQLFGVTAGMAYSNISGK